MPGVVDGRDGNPFRRGHFEWTASAASSGTFRPTLEVRTGQTIADHQPPKFVCFRLGLGRVLKPDGPSCKSGRYVPIANSCTAAKEHHSITSSAATRSVSGTVRPSAFAVLRLMTRR